ncbi:MAG: hypothetical protein GY913_34340 [Proteobacteria bacterium]|nr:hypothetical protein [Pseudomonadota bacterium]MCP4922009.1 hypothetical protein [Pseudomonadota bacterium]
MPIKPPNLDDRRYEDIVDEARALIPQYCPEWTNLNDADPGMTLVQLFAWMTEMTIYRLNRVPDKTYIHFLNFIGEERRPALPAVAPVTFLMRADRPVEVPAFTRVATRQREDKPALDYLTAEGITVHDATIRRLMAVRGGQRPAVRELPFQYLEGHSTALTLASGAGIPIFDIDPTAFGPDAYTPHQFLYVGHDDFRLMDFTPVEGQEVGHLRIRRTGGSDPLSIVNFFRWEYPTADGWRQVGTDREAKDQLGMPEFSLLTAMPGIDTLEQFGVDEHAFPLPGSVNEQKWWIRGRLDYEAWLAARMEGLPDPDNPGARDPGDLEITWHDDRGGQVRPLNNWNVRAAGRSLEFFLQDLPPMRGGWSIRFAMVDRSLAAGRNGYFPKYRWYYRRGDAWELIPDEQLRVEGTEIIVTGPLTDMASDGYNLRAERIQTVFLRGFIQDLELELSWVRPVELHMLAGDAPNRATVLASDEAPWSPWQLNAAVQPTIGRKWFIGSDLFENRRKAEILVEVEVAFEMNGEPVAEPVKDYKLQMTYRAEDNWRVVHDKKKTYAGFTFGTIDKEGAKKPGRRRVRFVIDPGEQLKGLARHTIGDLETTWLRLELIKSNLTGKDDEKNTHPVVPRIYKVSLGVNKTLGEGTYEQPLPHPLMAQVDHREHNRRLTRCVTQAGGRLSETHPYFAFVDTSEDGLALYLQFDKPLPRGERHAVHFRCRGESFLPEGVGVDWELLERRQHGRTAWRRLVSSRNEDEDGGRVYKMEGTGELEFALPDIPAVPDDGFWLRARVSLPQGLTAEQLPALPPITHIMLNTVPAVNLVNVLSERFSGLGVPNQVLELREHPIYVHPGERDQQVFPRPELFPDLAVTVEYPDGTREPWYRVEDLLTAAKDDPVYTVDPVDGTLHFGNGIRGRMLPVGTNNIVLDVYRKVPGEVGNVGAGEVTVCDGFADRVKVVNLLPAVGGRDAETIDEIIRRAPSLLTSRDRAVTQQDFEIIAMEASGEIARAACAGSMGRDGTVQVVILPHRREGELTPDPFLSSGLRDHVERYLSRRCLINIEPRVRLATFLPIDVSVTLRLRPNANQLVVREDAEWWVGSFLDPYEGGIDQEGWPFRGTLYAQDFARMVSDIPEVRHVVDVQIFDVSGNVKGPAGWEEGEGAHELPLEKHDLFVVRRIRIRTEDGSR